jgi:hypothetical protein
MRTPVGPANGMQRNLRYLLESNIAVQWRDWLAALAPNLVATLGEVEAWSLMRRTGRDLALARPLPVCETLAELEAEVGLELAQLNWGWARFAARNAGIDITHGAYPLAPTPDDPAGGWFAAVLEGLYTEWLGALAGDLGLHAITQARPESVGDVILLRYGRHGQRGLPFAELPR